MRLRVLEVLSTEARRDQGLQHETLPAGAAVVFYWGGDTVTRSFWMVNTPQPLALLWVRAGQVVGHVDMPRCELSCPTYKAPGPFDLAVEAPSGVFSAVKPSSQVVLS